MDLTLDMPARRTARTDRRTPLVLTIAAMLLALAGPAATPASAALCPDVPHSSDPVELDCASANERWAVIDATTGLVTNVVGWNGTNRWRPPAGQFAKDLPDGSPVGPGWWYVDGTFIRDSFARNVTATARILGVELRWSTGGLGTDTGDVTFTVDVEPTGQQFTTTGSNLLVDPLEAGVAHTFTVTATLGDGSTVQGPVVTATPQADPDPDCTDHSVARECRAATNWATVDPETMLVVNVSVCTPWQCGVDGEWGGRMPANSPWPNFLLIELDGPGGIGWKYVDGTFVDVRPREEPEEEAPAPTPDPSPAPSPAPAPESAPEPAPEPAPAPAPAPAPEADGPEGSSDGTAADPDSEPAPPAAPAPEGADIPDTPDMAEPGAPDADVSGPATTTPDPTDTTSDPGATSSSGTSDAATDEDATDEVATAGTADVDEAPARGPIRRVITGIVSFLRGLFGN